MNGQPDTVRTTLKVLGPVVMLCGVLLIIAGVHDEREATKRRDQQSREFMAGQRDIHDIDHGPPAGFFMIGGGAFAIVIGLGMLAFGFQKAIVRYQMRQYAPLVKEAIREVAPALAGGPVRGCARCNAENPMDARFCKQCGAALAHVCSGCGADNGSDARFCNSCGKPL
jgi:ribosomal protein L40E